MEPSSDVATTVYSPCISAVTLRIISTTLPNLAGGGRVLDLQWGMCRGERVLGDLVAARGRCAAVARQKTEAAVRELAKAAKACDAAVGPATR